MVNATVQPLLKEWAAKQQERRGWTYREMAEMSGLSHSTIALFFKPDAHVSFAACQAMANLFGTSATTVFELAELIPKSPPDTHDTRLLTDIYYRLSEEDRRELVNYAEYLRDGKRRVYPR